MKNELKAEKLENDFLDASRLEQRRKSTRVLRKVDSHIYSRLLINFQLWEVIRNYYIATLIVGVLIEKCRNKIRLCASINGTL